MLDEFKTEQPIVYKILRNAIKENKCSHAYLIESNGYSKSFDLAMAFAKSILCPKENMTSENCNGCTQCKNINNGEFLELKIIEAEGQWIKKNQLEELQNIFSKKSIIGNKKVYIIKGAEKLNVSSSNSLLKFLEEPEEGIVAILITENAYQLLDTIISRCQILSLNPLKKNVGNILEILGNNLYDTKEEINNYVLNTENVIKIEKVIEFIEYFEQNKLETLIYINKLWNQHFTDRNEIKIAINILMLFYKDVLNIILGNELEVFKEYQEIVEKIAKLNTLNIVISKINVIIKIYEKIKFNINNNLLMDKLLIELEGCEKCD